jgi:putative tryptophan/tyrosine transport system substrate-binding protein
MHRRRAVAAIACIGAAGALRGAFAQQGKVWRIGFLSPRAKPAPGEAYPYYAIVKGMKELGHVEGKDYVMEWRYTDGRYERFAELAAELVRAKVDIIVTGTPAGVRAAQRATSTIPIVIGAAGDPLALGLVASLSRPGGNTTGMSNITIELSRKTLELLRAAIPNLSRVAVLWNPDNPANPINVRQIQTEAKSLGLSVVPIEANTPERIKSGFAEIKRAEASAVIVLADGFFAQQRRQIAELGLAQRVATMYSNRELPDAGGLMSYGQNMADIYRRSASYIDRIMKGAKPGELPVEQPTKLELVVNLKTARAMGLSIPNEVLLRADEVIR